MKRNILVGKLMAEGLSEKTLVNLNDNQLLVLAERMLGEEEVGGYKEGPGEKNTPDFDHYNKIVKPQLSKEGFKDSYDKVMVPYGTENSMVYGNHNTGVNVVWDRKKGVYSVYIGNNKGLKTFQLGPNDSRVVANNVVKYALSLKGGKSSLYEQPTGKGTVMISKGSPTFNADVEAAKKAKKTIETYEQELKGGQKKLDKNHNGKIDGQDFKILKGQKKNSKKCDDCGKEVKDCKCDQSHLEESPKFGKKVTKGHNGIPEFMDSKKLKSEKSQVKEWVEKLVENQYHSFTSKNEIMELINVKLNENQPAPSKPTREAPVREKPSTKPEKPSRENPFEPKHKPKPKALGEEERIGNKPKMPEFMKSKNLGFKFKDQK